MDADTAKKLRAAFPAESVGKLPRVWCGKCRNAQFKVCDKHQSVKCSDCNNKMTTAHLHLDYVGHAAITDRLLNVDPTWVWEPVAFGPDGLPTLDKNGGLWIRLTVAGVTRYGYGDAEGKTGPSAIKEAIGDALRNGAMRFGVGLDLWHKDGPLLHDDDPPAAPKDEPAPPANGPDTARARLRETCTENGWDMDRVAALYAEKKSTSLRDATDVASITKFRDYLFSLPQTDLTATNGVAQ